MDAVKVEAINNLIDAQLSGTQEPCRYSMEDRIIMAIEIDILLGEHSRLSKVLKLMIEGYTQEEITKKLDVCLRTVAGDVREIKRRLRRGM